MSECMSGTRGSGVLYSTGDMLVRCGFDPSVARLLGHDPTPRPTCPVVWIL